MKSLTVTILVILLASCGGINLSSDGCILAAYQHNGSTYYAGPCLGTDLDGDGNADIDRFRVEWVNDTGDKLRATYSRAGGEVLIEYRTPAGVWVGWSSKSGVSLGAVPPEVDEVLQPPTK